MDMGKAAVFLLVTCSYIVTVRRVNHMRSQQEEEKMRVMERTQIIASLIRSCVEFTSYLELQKTYVRVL